MAGTYIYAAGRWCPVEPARPAELRILTERALGTPAYEPAAFTAVRDVEGESKGRDPATAEPGQAHGWVVRFFCEAKAADLALVFFAYCLLIAAGWLAWATLKLWKAGEQHMAVASRFADAAQKSADTTERSLTRLERPYILPSAVGSINFSDAPDVRHTVGFAVINYGKAPAILRAVIGKFLMLATLSKETLAADPPQPGPTESSDQRVSRTLAPSDRHTVDLGVPFQIYLEKHAGYARPPVDIPEKLYLSLTIEYLDVVAGIERSGVTLWVYDHGRHGFVSHGGADYNYERP